MQYIANMGCFRALQGPDDAFCFLASSADVMTLLNETFHAKSRSRNGKDQLVCLDALVSIAFTEGIGPLLRVGVPVSE